MNYYYDCEFLEGTQERLLILKSRLGHWMIGKQKPTIDLISIGIVSDDDREYYAISKDFNLKEAWNRYDEKVEIMYGDMRNRFPEGRKYKEYWIRENVLKPIFLECVDIELKDTNSPYYKALYTTKEDKYMFSYKKMKQLIEKYGKTNKQIADEVKDFCMPRQKRALDAGIDAIIGNIDEPINLYGYYSAYDHVVLCWLFGKMIDLPSGFPMYTIDLKQMLDEKAIKVPYAYTVEMGLKSIKFSEGYPKQNNEHNSLSDARWNKKLHQFIQSL